MSDTWVIYKEALDDHSTFRDCWGTIVSDLKNHALCPTSDTKTQFEDFACKMTGLWAMVRWDGRNAGVRGQ